MVFLQLQFAICFAVLTVMPSDAKAKLLEQIVALKAIGEDLRDRQVKAKSISSAMSKWNTRRILRNELNKFRQSVHLLEEDFNLLNISLKLRGENPFFSYIKLTGGIIAGVMSIIWYLHIILFILLPQLLGGKILWGFLDELFQLVSRANFYGLDLILYIVFIGYLMLCQMIGCFRFNMRVCFINFISFK